MKAPARKSRLDQLESKLRTALRRETTNVIEIGKLLLKCRERIEHGEWLDWLKHHFDLSQRTAHNYCTAAEYVARNGKLATVANLAPGVLYELAAGGYNEREEAEILAATRKGRVDQTRVYAICDALIREALEPPPTADDDADDDDAADHDGGDAEPDREITAILDGPPPDVPPPAPIAPPPNFALHAFDQAVGTLKQLLTKQAVEFAGTAHSAADLEGVECFIRAVADRARKARSQ